MTFKEKYKEELSKTRFTENFKGNTVTLLTQAAERKDNVFMTSKRKFIKTVALVAAIIMTLSLSAFAMISFLSSADVATHFGNKELAVLFEKSDFEPETIKGEDYSVTFMGTAQGESIYEIDGIITNEGRTYAVYAIYRNDGTALDILDGNPIHIIPVADGQKINAFTSYGMSASCFVKDGVLYALYDYTDIKAFTDMEISLMAFESSSSPFSALTANDNGEIVFADDYNGFKGKFSLK